MRQCFWSRLVSEEDPWAEDPAFLAEVMVSSYQRRKPQAELVNEMPLYPTEALLFDENQVPSVHYTGGRGAARGAERHRLWGARGHVWEGSGMDVVPCGMEGVKFR
jgi:hypothetical protein